MIKAESKGAERSLRSASPHRNAYKSDFHAIKCNFDGSKSEAASKTVTNGSADSREESRGRPFGTRVNKIKNIFLQMDGQQHESQEGKPTVKPDVPQTSPSKVPLPVTAHRSTFNSPSSPESHNLDKTPKGEDAEIDKVALAEKFSVTRKLFERGIKEQAVAEKQPQNRVVNRLSFGSGSDEGKSTRRTSDSSEPVGRLDQTHASAAKSHPDDMADGEKKQVSKVSLNAGPISKRLENYIVQNDTEDDNTSAGKGGTVSAKQNTQPTSPTRDSLHKPPSLVREATVNSPSLGSNFGHKPTTSAISKSVHLATDANHKLHSTEDTTSSYKSPSSVDRFNRTSVGGDGVTAHSPAPRDEKQPLASTGGLQNVDGVKYPEKAKGKDDKPPIQTSSPDSRVGGMVRAELVVVQNESSESEENGEDDAFKEQKEEQCPKDAESSFSTKKHLISPQTTTQEAPEERGADTVAEGRVLEDEKDFGLKEETEEDSFVASQDGEDTYGEEDEAAEEECALEKQVDRASPLVYGIENAAFVDDRDLDQFIQEEEEEEEEEQIYREYDDCYEAPGQNKEPSHK